MAVACLVDLDVRKLRDEVSLIGRAIGVEMTDAMIERARGAAAGLSQVRVTERFDCFRATTKAKTARKFGVHGANLFAQRP